VGGKVRGRHACSGAYRPEGTRCILLTCNELSAGFCGGFLFVCFVRIPLAAVLRPDSRETERKQVTTHDLK